MEAYHIEFKRKYENGHNRISAVLHIEMKKHTDTRKIPFTFNFGCIPYIINDLKKVWADERRQRISNIEEIDRSLPQ